MASLKDLRLRIKSVKNTRQITKTMKMVSAAKVRRARMACESARPYAEKLAAVLSGLAQNASGSLLLSGRDEVKTVRIIAFGSDRGLCGAFNSSLIREAHNQVKKYEAEGKKVEVVGVGNKVTQAAKYWPKPEENATYNDIARADAFELSTEIAQQTIADFEAGKCDKVVVVFGKFINMLTQEPMSLQLIPFAAEEQEDAGLSGGKEYEPEEEVILDTLLPRNVTMQVYRAMLETGASEQAARMTAMDNATRNAGDMIKKLSLKYNRGRQAAITTELIEIVAGAEAV